MNFADFNDNNHVGTLFGCLTVVLYFISAMTMHQIAGVCTVLSALSTIAINIRQFFKQKNK